MFVKGSGVDDRVETVADNALRHRFLVLTEREFGDESGVYSYT